MTRRRKRMQSLSKRTSWGNGGIGHIPWDIPLLSGAFLTDLIEELYHKDGEVRIGIIENRRKEWWITVKNLKRERSADPPVKGDRKYKGGSAARDPVLHAGRLAQMHQAQAEGSGNNERGKDAHQKPRAWARECWITQSEYYFKERTLPYRRRL